MFRSANGVIPRICSEPVISLLTVVLCSHAAYAAGPLANGYYTIHNGQSGLILDDPGFAQPGAQVIQWAPNSGANQNWMITYNAADKGYTIVNQFSGGYLTDVSGELCENAPSGSTNQLWTLTSVGGGYLVQNIASGRVIDDPDGSATQGTGMITWTIDTPVYGNQQWAFQPAGVGVSPSTVASSSTVTSPTSVLSPSTVTSPIAVVSPTNGTCGVANCTVLASAPVSGLCASGMSSSVSGSGPWTWFCAGSNGGATAFCSAQPAAPVVNGACGSASGATLTAVPAANLCSVGVSSTVSGSGPWNWSCAGSNGGTVSSCSAQLAAPVVNGACGSASGATLTAVPAANLCSVGVSSTVSGSGPWNWSCTGSNGGTTARCSASKAAAVVNGQTTVAVGAACTATSPGTALPAGVNGSYAGQAGGPLQPPPNSILVLPGGIQAAVQSHGPNTSFLLLPGTYTDATVNTKDGDAFYGKGLVTWNGNGQQVALSVAGTTNVLVSGIEFINFSPMFQGNGIFAAINGSTNFTLEGSTIAYNNVGTPVVVGNGSIIFNNCIHDNYAQGISNYQSQNVTVVHNELYNNNLAQNIPDSSTGWGSAIKFFQTAGGVIQYNYVHDNFGVGIWFDTDNTGSLIDSNYVTNNTYRGIMDETSYGATISNNTLTGNGYSTSWAPAGGIFISTASNVQVFNNIMKNNESGILIFEDDTRGSGSEGPYSASNDVVHDNYVAIPFAAVTGGAEQNSSNSFYSNHYCLFASQPFLIGGNTTGQNGWMAAGYDTNGTYNCGF